METGHNNGVYGVDPRTPVTGSRAFLNGTAVSWAAIFGGTFVILATTVILLTLGSGLGLSMASPVDGEGMSAAKIGISAIIWLIIVQWLSSFIGGYVSGRLRNRWEGLHGDEVFFRDSAHGLIAWAVAAVLGVALIFSTVSSMVGAGSQALSMVAAGAAGNERAADGASDKAGEALDYYIDSAFRTDVRTVNVNEEARDEAARIIWRGVTQDGVSDSDKAYLSTLISRSTSLDATQSAARVDEALAKIEADKEKAVQVADEARKTAAKMSLLTALSMVIGAFIASVAAILGGRHRDEF